MGLVHRAKAGTPKTISRDFAPILNTNTIIISSGQQSKNS